MSQFVAPAAAPAPADPAAAPAPADPNTPSWLQAAPTPATPDTAGVAAADLARLQGQVAAYQQMLSTGAAPAATAQQADAAAAAEKLLDVQFDDLTPEERETYKGSIPVMQKLMAQMLMQHVDPALQTLATRTSEAQTAVAQTASNTFDATLNATVPDLQKLARDPRFAAFANQPIPYTGGRETVRSRLRTAYENKDTATISGIMHEFRTDIARVDQGVPPLDAMQAPATAPSAAPVPRTPAPAESKPMLKFSARQQASSDYAKGRITREQLDQIDELYQTAFAEQRVDMNQ